MKKIAGLMVVMLVLAGAAFAQTPQTINVRLNKSVKASKSKLTVKVVSVEDSRCPKDANCVWAGNAKVTVVIKSGSIKSELKTDLNTGSGDKSVKFEGYEITLVDVTPYPASNVRINKNAVTAKFEIKKNTSQY